jgi:hypothetical protein
MKTFIWIICISHIVLALWVSSNEGFYINLFPLALMILGTITLAKWLCKCSDEIDERHNRYKEARKARREERRERKGL